jgi:hypothetical protein
MISFLKELGYAVFALILTTLGLLVIWAITSAAVEEITNWWQFLIGSVLALAIIGAGAGLLAIGTALTTHLIARGWVGMLMGNLPEEFADRSDNRWRASAGFTAFALSLLGGIPLFRYGVAESELNFAIEGLFLVFAGFIFGLLPAIPRGYYSFRDRAGLKREKKKDKEGAQATWFMVAALFGIGLSLSVSEIVTGCRNGAGNSILPLGEWVDGTTKDVVDYRVVPRDTRRSRVEYLSISCPHIQWLDEEGKKGPSLTRKDLKREGIEYRSPKGKIKQFVFDPSSQKTYRVRIGKKGVLCVYSVRYRYEPAVSRGGMFKE